MALPNTAILRDHKLEEAATTATDELMEHRWHWTLDESNPKRVSIREYARCIGRGETTIRADVNGWAAWLAEEAAHVHVRTPGKARTPNDHRELAKLGADKKHAVEALAKATGKSVSAVTSSHKREEVNSLIANAKDRAERRGTTVEHEIEQGAAWKAKAEKAAAQERDEKKRKHTMRFIKIEGHIGSAMRYIRKALTEAEDVEFTDDEREIMVDTLGKLRALLNLVDLRIAGTVDIDWDAEFQKIAE